MWSENSIAFYFNSNENLLNEYYGSDYFKIYDQNFLTKIRFIIKRLSQLLPNSSHNTPGWDHGTPIIAISRISSKDYKLEGKTRIILTEIKNKLHIGFRKNKNNGELFFKKYDLNNILKEYTQEENLDKEHSLFDISSICTNIEFSDSNPLISNDFENILKKINQDYFENHNIEFNNNLLNEKGFKDNTPITPKTFISIKKNKDLILLNRNSIKPIEERKLELKNDYEINYYKETCLIRVIQLHNTITNNLIYILERFKLYEGTNLKYKYDLLIENFNLANDNLLVEIKSTNEIPDIRMAVGQLLHYSYKLKLNEGFTCKKAILLNKKPEKDVINFLKSIDIGLLWLDENSLHTEDIWLKNITTN